METELGFFGMAPYRETRKVVCNQALGIWKFCFKKVHLSAQFTLLTSLPLNQQPCPLKRCLHPLRPTLLIDEFLARSSFITDPNRTHITFSSAYSWIVPLHFSRTSSSLPCLPSPLHVISSLLRTQAL